MIICWGSIKNLSRIKRRVSIDSVNQETTNESTKNNTCTVLNIKTKLSVSTFFHSLSAMLLWPLISCSCVKFRAQEQAVPDSPQQQARRGAVVVAAAAELLSLSTMSAVLHKVSKQAAKWDGWKCQGAADWTFPHLPPFLLCEWVVVEVH